MSFPGTGAPGGGAGAVPGYDMNDPNLKMMQRAMESCFVKAGMTGVGGFGMGALFGMFMASMAYDTPFHTPGAPVPAAAVAGVSKTAAPGTASAAAAVAPSVATPATAAAAQGAKSVAATAAAGGAATGAVLRNAAATAAAAATTATPATVAATTAATGTPAVAGAATGVTPTLITSLPLRQQLAHGFRDMGSRSLSTAKNFGKVGMLYSGVECGIEGLRAKNDMVNGVTAGCLTGAILARNAGPQAAAVGCAGFAAFSAAIDAYLRMPAKDD